MDFSEPTLVNATLWLLGFFSLLTWSIILIKLSEWSLNALRNYFFINNQSANDNSGASSGFSLFDKTKSPFARIFLAGQETLIQIPGQTALAVDQYSAWHQLIERTLSQQIQKEKAKMDAGLGWLASFGSTSPFVGLFGTVWGIMHALQDISAKGSASLEVVAGPIGEALIATAIGISVAIPAVLAYNFFMRLNRASLARMNHFADDYLRAIIRQHLQLQTQQPTANTHGVPNPR